jgi:HlyD family secretion protein
MEDMDIARQVRNKRFTKRHIWIAGVVAAGTIALLARGGFGSASYVADKDDIVIGEVRRGDFSVQIRGVGILQPKDIHMLAINVDGLVESIAVEAGTRVKKGDVVARMVNPRLTEQLEEARWELEAKRKENRAAESALRSQLSNLRADAKNAELDYLSTKVKLDAEQKLVDQGIVSKITVEQSRLAVEQHRQRILSQRERVERMEDNLSASVEANLARIAKLERSTNQIEQQIEDLTIRAGIDGVIQVMSLELGQRATAGTQAGRIAPHDNLIALLDVQDFQIKDIATSQAVTIDTRTSKIAGRVARIEPSATNGVVKVEVALQGRIPSEARSDLSVEGIIDVEKKHNVLYVERPAFARSQGKVDLYRVDGDVATRSTVQFGRASTRHIEVITGLKAGDRVIVSDASAWDGHDVIGID